MPTSSQLEKKTKKIRPSVSVPRRTMPLQDDTPSAPRKRSNSIIPIELMMNNNDEGGRERVVLATVFGVPEYIDSKAFWERGRIQQQQQQQQQQQSSTKSTPHTTVAGRLSFSYSDDISHQSKFVSYVDSILGQVGSNELLDPSLLGASSHSTPTPTPSKSFALPRIPTVSEFDDILSDSSPDLIVASPTSINLETLPPTPQQEVKQNNILLPESKLDVIVGPPDIFDLLISDQDERFIIWGPDPMLLSSSMATTTPSSYATLYNSQHKRPELKGFSSNRTTNTVSSKHNSRASLSEENGSMFLKKAFGLKKKKKQEQEQEKDVKHITKVIEAASAHKLIEKLTNTLDYTLMTDFFLTYRDFLKSEDLCRLLISRFYWALKNDEESRRIVRIRTFVIFRHWLNNYFVHDFIGNKPLRVVLTQFLNDLPRHPLVRESPRDQRIVKILKRVLRRLKKLYYQRSSGAIRVKVIPPPPPTAEQEQMSEIVRAKLSQSAIRRKTAIGLDMSSHYHGNMAVQDARYAPVLVVGSLNKKSSFIDSGVESSSMAGRPVDDTSIHYRYDKNAYSKSQEVSSVISVTSDDSLESEISAGDTIPNESDESDDDYNNEGQTDDEHDREWIREQQETLEYFRSVGEINTEPIQFASATSESSSLSTPTTPLSKKEEPTTLVFSNAMQSPSSERWCKSYELAKHPLDDTTSLPIEILQELSETETQVPTGLSKRLSRKSIERRKSEKSLNEMSPKLVPEQEVPQLPELPQATEDTKITKKRYSKSLRRRKSSGKSKNDQQEAAIEPFAAIPYEATQVAQEPKQEETQDRPPRLTRVLSKVFKHAQEEKNENKTVEQAPVKPLIRVETTFTPPAEPEPQSSHLVSLIAKRLRYNSVDESIHPGDDACECSKCSGNKDSTSPCHRLSVMIMPDEERRQSIELRRKRGASFIMENKTKKDPENGPVYLGNLQPQDDAVSVKSVPASTAKSDIPPSSAKSTQTDLPESSVRARMSVISEFSEFPHRSKVIELDIRTESQEPPSVIPVSTIQPGRCFIMSYKTSILASQFCFVERDVLVKVGWEELIHCKWTKMDPNGNVSLDAKRYSMEETGEHVNYTRQSEKKRNEGKGIEQVIQRFNTVCQWVATEIVRTNNTNERVKLVEKFIKLAKKCQLYSNYATLVQILLGLQSPAVARLEKTWSKVSPKYQKILAKLTEFTSPMKNWKHIRDSMTEVAEEYGNSPSEVQVELPGTSSHNKFTKTTRIKIPFGGCIPFLGIYLSDLVFNFEKPRYLKPNLESQRIYMANNTRNLPACLEQPLINFRKHRVIATVVKRVLTFQSLAMRYSFDEDLYLIEKCRDLQVLDAATIRELSNSLE